MQRPRAEGAVHEQETLGPGRNVMAEWPGDQIVVGPGSEEVVKTVDASEGMRQRLTIRATGETCRSVSAPSLVSVSQRQSTPGLGPYLNRKLG